MLQTPPVTPNSTVYSSQCINQSHSLFKPYPKKSHNIRTRTHTEIAGRSQGSFYFFMIVVHGYGGMKCTGGGNKPVLFSVAVALLGGRSLWSFTYLSHALSEICSLRFWSGRSAPRPKPRRHTCGNVPSFPRPRGWFTLLIY